MKGNFMTFEITEFSDSKEVFLKFNHPLVEPVEEGTLGTITAPLKDIGARLDDNTFYESLDILIENKEYHNGNGRELANANKLNEQAIKLFFDFSKIKKIKDHQDTINSYLLKPKHHITVNIKGASGAGKTTLLSNLLNLDKTHLATSSNKTTVGTREFIIHPTEYALCCTFIDQLKVQMYLKDIVFRTIEAIVTKGETEYRKIKNRFIDSADQQFRIQQLLGVVNEENVNIISRLFNDFVGYVKSTLEGNIQQHSPFNEIDTKDKEEILKTFLYEILDSEKSEAFQLKLLSLIKGKVHKFVSLYQLDHKVNEFGWVEEISCHNISVALCHELILNLSSIKWNENDMLLTPLVHTMRAVGPFYPTWVQNKDEYNFHFIDGMGLDHDQKDARSVPTHISNEIWEADYIIWLENAMKITDNTTKLFFEHLVLTSQLNKVVLYHTHLAKLNGDRFEDEEDKKNAVDSDFEHVFQSYETTNLATRITKEITHKTFYFEDLNDLSDENVQDLLSTIALLKKPIDVCKLSTEVALLIKEDILLKKYLNMMPLFWDEWNPRANRAHWKTFKAMTTRLAYYEDIYGFYPLYPVEEASKVWWMILYETLNASVNKQRNNEQELKAIVESLTNKMVPLISQEMVYRIAKSKKAEWITADTYAGERSSNLRKDKVKGILSSAIPKVSIATLENNELYKKFISLLQSCIDELQKDNPLVAIQIEPRMIPELKIN